MRSRSLHNKLFISCAVPFRFQQLPLARQKKDRQIKKQRLELEKKRKQYEDIQLHWQMAQTQFRQFSQHQQQKNTMLQLKQTQLRKDVFRLAIRRDQVQSRSNPAIAKSRANILRQYLFCVPFSVGNRFECVSFWQSEDIFMRRSFLLQSVLDRKLCRTQVQRHIKSNLDCIVHCNKVRFNDELLMLCIKEVGQQRQSIQENNNRHWNSVRKDERKFQVMLYAVTGPYFCIKKVYSFQELTNFAVSLGSVISLKLNRPRLSVADNLIKANVLKSLALQKSESRKMSSPKITYQLISESNIIKEGVDEGMSSDSSISEPESPAAQERGSEGFTERVAQFSNQQLSQASKDVSSGESEQSIEQKQNNQTKQSIGSKSSFYHKAKSEEKQICKLNRQFLMGHQILLFPKNQPLMNLVVFIKQGQFYLLPEYIELPKKRHLLIESLAKFRLKMKLKAELRKCLLYRVVDLSSFYETEMFLEKDLQMKFLFVIKRQDTAETRQINLYCDSIRMVKRFQKAISIKHNMLRQVIDKVVLKEEKNNYRNSNKGGRKDSSHRSRESRKKSIHKNQLKLAANENERLNFMDSKFGVEEWAPFSQKIKCKLQYFLKNNLLSIRLKTFIPVMQLTIKRKSIIKIQANARRYVYRTKHLKAVAHRKRLSNYHPSNGVLITCLSLPTTNQIIVFVQGLRIADKDNMSQFRFSSQYSEIIFKAVHSFHIQGSLAEVKDRISGQISNSIKTLIQEKARRQAERPEKNKLVLQRFLFVTCLRLRARSNVFLVKKIAVRQKLFLLIIRRDALIRSLLQCNLYEITNCQTSQYYIGSTCSGKQSKDIVSQYGFHKPFPQSSRDLVCRNLRYQTIHMADQYFAGIDKKYIVQQFLIDRGVFLLKPQKSPSIYYIERLSSIDINSDDVIKEVNAFHREEQSQFHKHGNQSSFLPSNISLKKSSPSHMLARRVSSNSRFKEKIGKDLQNKKGSAKQKGKKISIDGIELIGLSAQQPNSPLHKATFNESRSKVSLADTESHKNAKQLFKIVGNSHESTVYFSLFKSEDIFFYLQFYIVSRVKSQKGYSEELTFIDRHRIYKKQLEEHGMALIPKRLAQWIHSNEADFIQIKEKDRMVDVSRRDFGDVLP